MLVLPFYGLPWAAAPRLAQVCFPSGRGFNNLVLLVAAGCARYEAVWCYRNCLARQERQLGAFIGSVDKLLRLSYGLPWSAPTRLTRKRVGVTYNIEAGSKS